MILKLGKAIISFDVNNLSLPIKIFESRSDTDRA